MPSIESINYSRSSGELSRGDSRRLGDTAMNATKKFSEMTKEERNAFFDSIAKGSNEPTPPAPRTPENSRNSERIRETKEKAKRNSGLKGIIAGATVGAVAVGMLAGAWFYAKNTNKNANPPAPTSEPELGNFFQAPETPSDYEAYNLGIYDGYNEPGMFTSENKTSSVAFADAGEVAEICNNDECEMIKYTAHNQVESFADYMANLPEQLQPEGFRGLSLKEAEAKLENLSDEDFTLVENQFRNIIDSAFTRRVVKNGTFHNAFMRHKGGDFIHENMELVHCTTNESNLEVTEFYWVDQNGNEIGTMDVKIIPVRDKDGNIVGFKGCEQVINPYEGVYVMLPDITPEPDNPDPTKTPSKPDNPDPTKTPSKPDNPDPTKTPVDPTKNPTPLATKNPEEEKKHAGDRVDARELNEEVTPATGIKQDQENFKAIEQQKQEDASRKAEANRVASDQAEKEKQAATEAESKRQAEKEANERKAAEEKAAEAERQRLANEAAKKAQAEAEAAQRAAAEAERKAAAEREAREKAQAEANARAAADRKEAESNANATAQERADAFENGDF